MADYKLYCLDRSGRITSRHEFIATDDEAALETSRATVSGVSCELWCGARRVALLPADGDPVLARPAA